MEELMAPVWYLHGLVRQRMNLDRTGDERGEGSVVQTVILVALFAAAAIVIAGIIITKFTDKAKTIPTG